MITQSEQTKFVRKKNFNDGSIAITHGEIEYLLVFIKNKNNIDNFTKLYKGNQKISIEDYIDVKEFEKKYGYKIINLNPYGRSMEATHQFIEAIKNYYDINILNFNEDDLMEFFKFYIKEFPNLKSFTKLNIHNWGLRSLEIKEAALKKLIKHVKLYNEISK